MAVPSLEGAPCAEGACAEGACAEVACGEGASGAEEASGAAAGAGRARLAVRREWVPLSRWSFRPPVLLRNSGNWL